MLTRALRRLDREDGFSLVELIVVMAILVIVATIMANGAISGMRATRAAEARVDAVTELEQALQRMTREIRAAHPLPVGNVEVTPIALAADNEIQVRAQRREGGATRRFSFSYRRAGSEVVETRRSAAATADPATGAVFYGPRAFVTAVRNAGAQPIFTYYDVKGNVLPRTSTCTGGAGTAVACLSQSDRRRIARVGITLVRGRAEQRHITLSTIVTLRNQR